jgi:hypothetical protein
LPSVGWNGPSSERETISASRYDRLRQWDGRTRFTKLSLAGGMTFRPVHRGGNDLGLRDNYRDHRNPREIHNVTDVRRPSMPERAPSKSVISATVLVLAAMLLIAVLYTINPVHRQIVASPHAFIPATGRVEWRDR